LPRPRITLARLIEVRASDQVRDGVGGLSLLGREKMIA
jgi:hypothetical protein